MTAVITKLAWATLLNQASTEEGSCTELCNAHYSDDGATLTFAIQNIGRARQVLKKSWHITVTAEVVKRQHRLLNHDGHREMVLRR